MRPVEAFPDVRRIPIRSLHRFLSSAERQLLASSSQPGSKNKNGGALFALRRCFAFAANLARLS
jgi:hypothetical protein